MVQTLKTKGNAALKEKLKKQAGFTLVELLIVVAIIAILAAIAIPAYSAQMENARQATDRDNARAASSLATSDYLLHGFKGSVKYTYTKTAGGNLAISKVESVGTAAVGDAAKITAANTEYSAAITAGGGAVTSGLVAESKKVGTAALTVTLAADGIMGNNANSWLTALDTTTATPPTT